MTFTHWFEYFQRSSIHDGTYSIGEEAWNAAKADDTPPNPQHGREPKKECKDCVFYHKLVPGNCVSVSACKHQQRVLNKAKPLAQYLFEHDCEYADVRSSYEYFQQALDAYQSTENVTIKIEGV